MLELGQVHIHLLPVLALLALGLLVTQAISLLLAPVNGRSLLAWSVGVFGVSAIYLRKPNPITRFVQFVAPIAAAVFSVGWLLRGQPAPVSGLTDAMTTRLWLIAAIAVIVTLPRLWGALHELRYPLWGEARVIDRVARSQLLGAIIYFTAAGRAYLRDRFGASPEEFLRIVRQRRTPYQTLPRS